MVLRSLIHGPGTWRCRRIDSRLERSGYYWQRTDDCIQCWKVLGSQGLWASRRMRLKAEVSRKEAGQTWAFAQLHCHSKHCCASKCGRSGRLRAFRMRILVSLGRQTRLAAVWQYSASPGFLSRSIDLSPTWCRIADQEWISHKHRALLDLTGGPWVISTDVTDWSQDLSLMQMFSQELFCRYDLLSPRCYRTYRRSWRQLDALAQYSCSLPSFHHVIIEFDLVNLCLLIQIFYLNEAFFALDSRLVRFK